MLNQEAWEKYLRVAGTGEKGEPGEGRRANPPKERGKEEKEKSGQKDKEGDERERSREGEGEPTKGAKGSTTLKFGPVCCSCSRNGVHDIAHTAPISTPTFITRPIRPNSTTGIGLCLMPSSRGTIKLNEGPACGHTPCPSCTVVKQERTMCKCCADRIEAHGAGVGGAGPLPPLQLEEEDEARETRSNSFDSRAGPSRARRGRERPTSPSRRPVRRASKSQSPVPERKRRREETAPRREIANPSSGRTGRVEEDEEYEMIPEESPGERGCQNCGRHTRGRFAVCCEACYKTGGRAHTAACDAWNKKVSKPPPDYRRDGPEGDDDDTDPDDEGGAKGKRKGKRKGKGKGKVVVYKTYNKWVRDNERWRSWVRPGRQKAKMTNVAAYKEALQMGRAESTKKSHESRLRTWDSTLVELERQGMIALPEERNRLTPALVKAGVASLKSKGYRSAELYLSSAICRHKETQPIPPGLVSATREAVRMAKRNRGPAKGKQPIPIPPLCEEQFDTLMIGIWYLLRVGELVNIRLSDVRRRQGPDGLQAAVFVRKSKTDQEGLGSLVTRDCTCSEDEANLYCPAHILLDLTAARMGEAAATGMPSEVAHLCVDKEGRPLTQQSVLQAVERVAVQAGETLWNEGQAKYGTHSLRTTGALMAFTAGVPEETIKALGRWATTEAMNRYLRGTPVVQAAGATKIMARAIHRTDHLEVNKTTFEGVTDRPWKTKEAGRVQSPEEINGMVVIRHSETGLVHRPGTMTEHPDRWTTWCGWKWVKQGTAGMFRVTKSDELCKKCFTLQK